MTDTAALLKLLAWLSPAFPTGGFAYSHGLEQAIADGAVADAETLKDWVSGILTQGSGWNDAVLLVAAWQATRSNDREQLRSVAELAAALSPTRERALETLNQGEAFIRAMAAWPSPSLHWLVGHGAGRVALPIAVGTAAGDHGIPLVEAVGGYLQTFVSNLVSVAVRLVPLGQSDGLRVVSDLQAEIANIAGRAAAASLDDLGSSAIMSDIAAMRHETLYSRVFRS